MLGGIHHLVMSQLQIAKRHPLKPAFGVLDFGTALAHFWQRRGLLWHMTVRHLRSQYKQSILGYAWAILNPLSLMLILSFVFSTILRIPSQGIPYPLFLLVAL